MAKRLVRSSANQSNHPTEIVLDASNIGRLLSEVSDWVQNELLIRQDSKSYVSVDEIGALVKKTRKEQKVNLTMLAALAGVSLGTVQNLESGKQTVNLENAAKILGVLGKKIWIA